MQWIAETIQGLFGQSDDNTGPNALQTSGVLTKVRRLKLSPRDVMCGRISGTNTQILRCGTQDV